MKYGVKNFNDGKVSEDSKTDVFETARVYAVNLSNWNIECEVVDLKTGEPLKHFDPYNRM